MESEKQWNSTRPRDIAAVTGLIESADNELAGSSEFNAAAAEYFSAIAKNDEAALKFYFRLYFNSPENRYSFQIRYLFRRIANFRLARAMKQCKNDPEKVIRQYIYLQPRMVEDLLRSRKKDLPRPLFVRCCLAACDSPDLQLRSFAFGELLHCDLSPIHDQAEKLLNSPDPSRRALAALLLPDLVTPEQLPAALAVLGNDEYAIVRMTADSIARTRCQEAAFARYQKLLKRSVPK